MTVRNKVRAASAATAGAGIMYFVDPDSGRTRRTRGGAQAKAAVRRSLRGAARTVDRRVQYTEGRLEGALARAAGGGHFKAASEADIREHVRQVVAEFPFPTSDVNTELNDGIATLRGQVVNPDHLEQLPDTVAQVDGVSGVRSYLHLPGESAPNKVPAHLASRG